MVSQLLNNYSITWIVVMYIPDLALYKNAFDEIEPNTYCIGWLDNEHDYPVGDVDSGIVDKILELCFTLINPTRSFHQSPFINSSIIGYPVEMNGQQLLLGSAEVKIKSKTGKIYMAPNLIYHYIKDCRYLPPEEFIEAIRELLH